MTAKQLLYDLFQDVLWNLNKDATESLHKIREFNLNGQRDASQYEQNVLDALERAEKLIISVIERVEGDYFESAKVDVDYSDES